MTLVRAGCAVALVERRSADDRWRIGEGAPPGLDRAVDDVFGSGTFVAADHLCSFGNRAAWGTDELATMDFMLNPFGSGWHLDRAAFDARLLAVAAGAGVEVVARWPDRTPGLVVDASGRRAVHARRCGARLVVHDRLTAVVANYTQAQDDADATTTVEAAEAGWWYTSPIPGGRRVVAFLTDGDLLHPSDRSPGGFTARAASTHHISRLVTGSAEDVRVVAAGTAHLDRPVGDGWLAVGDAAGCFDPLSSQGILTAVLMGGAVTDDAEAYAQRYRAIVERNRAEQQATYDAEQRWPDAPFWRRRR